MFKTRRSQSTVSSISDVFADEATTKIQPGLSVSGMKLRSEKNLDGNQGRSGEIGQASVTLTDPFVTLTDPTRLPPPRGPGRARRGL